jgi:DNA polymerase III epsilon subunit-like protein
MKSTIIVFDFETTSLEAGTDKCDPVEIGAVAIHSRNLKVIEGSQFFVKVRPDKIGEPDYYEKHKSTIDWHLSLAHNKGKTAADMIAEWAEGVPEKTAWRTFADYVNSYNYANSYKTAPIPAGQNIKGFDLKIYDYLCEKHKTKPFFSKRDAVDTKELSFYWLSYAVDQPRSISMDDLRPYFGMSSDMGHNALADVLDEAGIAIMYLGLLKKFAQQTQFRNSLRAYGR